jgi:hypothetical protein
MVNFIGIGAQKSGTSWVYACLYEHPEICAPIKEIHYFSRPRFEKGTLWYESHFAQCASKKQKGEFSTSYLYSKETPQRIRDLYPDVKLIAILRNPVDRAISQYRNAIKSGEITEAVSFETFVQEEESVINQGKYHEQLERYYALFSQEQILVLIYEDIKKDPRYFMQQIYRFLVVDDTFVSSMLNTEINIARTPKVVVVDRVMHKIAEFLRRIGFDSFVHVLRKTGLPDFVRSFNTKDSDPTVSIDRKKLAQYFTEDTAKLSELLDRDLNTEWLI